MGSGAFFLQMIENRGNGDGILDGGDDPHCARTGLAGFDVDIEDPLETLCPAHGGVSLAGCFALGVDALPRTALAPVCRCHLGSPLTIRSEHPVKARQIHPWPRHQRGQSYQEIQWLEKDVRCSIAVRRLELVARQAVVCQ